MMGRQIFRREIVNGKAVNSNCFEPIPDNPFRSAGIKINRIFRRLLKFYSFIAFARLKT